MIEGSTGAAGLRGFERDTPTSFELSVLYFSPQGVLRAYDELTVSGAGQSQVSLRRVLAGDKLTASPSVTATATPSGAVTVTSTPSTAPANPAPVVPAPDAPAPVVPAPGAPAATPTG
jgi:hypothetical protein